MIAQETVNSNYLKQEVAQVRKNIIYVNPHRGNDNAVGNQNSPLKTITQALKNEPITVYGTGEQSRCFAHVYDVVESIVRMINEPKAVGQVFNIGNDQEVSINELAQIVKKATGSTSEIVKMEYDEVYSAGFEEMQRRKPNVSKLEEFIGYRPRTPLAKIVEDVIAEKKAQ